MVRPLSFASALAGVVLALGASAASAGDHGHARQGGFEFRRPSPAAATWSVRPAMAPLPSRPRVSQGFEAPVFGSTGAGFVHTGYGAQRPMMQGYGPAQRDRSGLGAWRMAERVDGYGGPDRMVPGGGSRQGASASDLAGRSGYGGAPSGVYRTASAPLVIRYGERRRVPSRGSSAYGSTGYGYGSSGFGYGSTGYGYGGDFSNAYSSGYDDNQTLGYATEEATEDQSYASRGYGAANYGAAGYGYGGTGGWSPAIGPAGGLAVYSPGAYGPGPRIVTIPSYYRSGSTSPLGCTCSARRGF